MTVSLASINARLRKVEARRGFSGEVATASDAQLLAIVRGAHAGLRAEHGSLAAAIPALRATGDGGDAALAVLIEEDIGHDAQVH